jgi:hypothetical protein
MSPSNPAASFFTAIVPYLSFDPLFPPANRHQVIARGVVSSKLMNVGLPGNDALLFGWRKTRPAMGEIVDLEHYRKLRWRREADAEKTKRGDAPDSGESEASSSASATKRTGPGPTGLKGAAETGDEPKTD